MNNKHKNSLIWKRGDNPEIHDTEKLTFTDQITVEAWVECNDPQAENFQSLVSKWNLLDDFNTFSAFDAGNISGLDSKGYLGATFDGRYVYFAPQANHTLRENGTRRHGIALRYDTHGNFKDTKSWQAFDAGNIDGLNTKGYYGVVFDGRFIFFVPRFDGTEYHSRVLRYDTAGQFDNRQSWAAHDVGVPVSYQSGSFDGRYLYLVPGHRPDPEVIKNKDLYKTTNTGNGSGEIVRYDTKADFKADSSWQIYNAAQTSGLNTVYFDGAVFDGRYMYFVPLFNGAVLRCDTQADFDNPDSWSAFDASYLNTKMRVGAIFDGRYIYFVPYSDGIVIRYDTHHDFIDQGSWTSYDAGNTGGLDSKGFDGAVFDGKYIYFVPYWNNINRSGENFHGTMLRYDANKDFCDPTSWQAYNAENTDGLDTRGYNGAAFDGKYIYFAAWEKGEGENCNIKGHGNFLRYDTVGNHGTFSLRYIDIGHNGGLGASLPGTNFIVNTEKGAISIRANKIPEPGKHYIAGVYDGRKISLYIDGILVNEQAAYGKIQSSNVPICIGKIQDGLGTFKGIIKKVRISNSAQSPEWIRQQYVIGKN